MPLIPGTRLGVYEVMAQIGAGGMGQVYRATDTTLGRQVAIKILPDAFAQDAERLARFEREAKTLAALNHPNIAAIYGLERSSGTLALVMELVEGDDLSQRIARGAIPLDEALPIAKQIAEALEAAHERGIIHRDLKPANIKVRADGTVKVLDFGLAKGMDPPAGLSPNVSQSPTVTSPAMTQAGMILGTAAYMSPEQARGKVVDKRADIWAFGCVLYETLTGRRPFVGEDVPLTLSNVLQREPDWDALPTDVPALLATFLRRCLAKDPRQRVRDMGDIRLALDGAFELAGMRGPALEVRFDIAPWQRPLSVAAIVLGAVAVSALTTWTFTRPAPALPAAVTRTSIVLPPTQTRTNFGRRGIAISPSGSHFVYVANQQLYLRAFDELEARPMAGSEQTSPADPFFSPDGRWIGFFSLRDGALEKVALGGGAAVRLAAASSSYGASWGEDDTIVYAQDGQGILRLSASGGKPEVLLAVEAPAGIHQPQMLPGGKAVLYTRCASSCFGPDGWDAAQVVVEDLATGERTVAVNGGTDARYLPTGHLVYALRDTLLAIPFDVSRRAVTGGPVLLVGGVSRAGINGAANADLSRTGTLVYVAGGVEGTRTLVWVDRTGREEMIPAPLRPYYTPRLSPDGTRVVVFANDAERDLWAWDFARASLTRLTVTPTTETFGVWTPDGRRVVFASGRRALYWRAADGTGVVERLLEGSEGVLPMSISPDGTRLVYSRGPVRTADLHVLTLDAERRSEPLIVTEFGEWSAEISPDGRWLAYQSNSSGQDEVYVRPFPAVDRGLWKISTAGGDEPLWSADGRELFYRTQAGLMRVPLETTSGFTAGVPSLLVAGAYFGGAGRSYDISRDGQRFLMLKARIDPNDPLAGLTQIIVVQHWMEELKDRLNGRNGRVERPIKEAEAQAFVASADELGPLASLARS
ncbi:MAG: protein kinase [Vicinamibacterales bacterium]